MSASAALAPEAQGVDRNLFRSAMSLARWARDRKPVAASRSWPTSAALSPASCSSRLSALALPRHAAPTMLAGERRHVERRHFLAAISRRKPVVPAPDDGDRADRLRAESAHAAAQTASALADMSGCAVSGRRRKSLARDSARRLWCARSWFRPACERAGCKLRDGCRARELVVGAGAESTSGRAISRRKPAVLAEDDGDYAAA